MLLDYLWDRISTHAPHVGSDSKGQKTVLGQKKFQSTLPIRGATGV